MKVLLIWTSNLSYAMKIYLAVLLKDFKIVPTPETLHPGEWHMKKEGFFTFPSKPLIVGFEKR